MCFLVSSSDLPTIKYIKDNEDDCDLDPQLYVGDLLLDEGKAERDGADQRVTIKVILEQGRALREGSVAVGSLLDNPQFQLQWQATSRPPPVPKFPGVASALGKRSMPPRDAYHPADGVNGSKRLRKEIEIPETQREESVVSSIERDGRRRSDEIVRDTQDEEEVRQDHRWQHQQQQPQWQQHEQQLQYQQHREESHQQELLQQQHEQQHEPHHHQQQHQQLQHLEPKAESPELYRSFHSIPAATVDELEELPGQPYTFGSRQRGPGESRASFQRSSEPHQPNGVSSTAQGQNSQAPITPPTEASTGRSTSARLRSHSKRDDATSIPLPRSSTSASKFKRRDIYDFPESDIDDTQMSPRSKQARLGSRKSTDRLSRIEFLRSPDHDRAEEARHRLSVNEALDALDNGSVFEDDTVAPQDFVTPEMPTRDNAPPAEESSDGSIYEDAPTDEVQMREANEGSSLHRHPSPGIQGPGNQKASTPAPALRSDDEGGDKENHLAIPTSAQPVSQAVKTVFTHEPTTTVPSKAHATLSPAKKDNASEEHPAPKRGRKRKSGKVSINGDEPASQTSGGTTQTAAAQTPLKAAPKPARQTTKPQRTPSLDSPGEQLSQSLQESARKQVSAKALDKKLATQQPKQPRTPAAGKKRTQDTLADKTGPSNQDTPGTALKKTPRQRKSRDQLRASKTDADSAAQKDAIPSVVVQRSEEAASAVNPLPNWGSSPAIGVHKQNSPNPEKQESAANQDKSNSLAVDRTPGDSRKSPSIPVGFTEEEIRIMKSREGMTKEQYEAEKKRKQRLAAEQRKKEAAARRESAGKTVREKTPKASSEAPAPAATSGSGSTGNKARKSFGAEDAPKHGRTSFFAEDASKPARKSFSAEDASQPARTSVTAEDAPKPARKSFSAEDASKAALKDTSATKSKDDTISDPSESVTSAKRASTAPSQATSSSTASSSNPRKSDSGVSAMTPANTSIKSPSVKSATTTATAAAAGGSKPVNAEAKTQTKTQAKRTTPAPAKKPTPAPAHTPASLIKSAASPSLPKLAASRSTPGLAPAALPKPAAPTIATAKRLTELHAAIRNATQAMASSAASSSFSFSRASSRPGQKRSVLNTSTDDDDDDDDSEDDSEDDEEEDDRNKGNANTNTNTNHQNKVQNPNQSQKGATASSPSTSSSGSSDDDDDDDDSESESEGQQHKGKSDPRSQSKQGANASDKSATTNAKTTSTDTAAKTPAQSQSQGPGRSRTSLSQPDRSIRDASVDSDDDGDSDDDDDDDDDDEL